MALQFIAEGSPRPRVGVKPPPGGAVGGCPAVPAGLILAECEAHEDV